MPWQIFWQPPSPICEGRWHHGRYDGLKWRILAFLHGLSAAIWNWLYLAIVLVEASVLFLLLNMKLTWFFTFLRKLECELNSRILHFYSPPDVHLFDLLFFFFLYAVLGNFVSALNKFIADRYSSNYSVSEYHVYEFFKVSPGYCFNKSIFLW